jgi:hypothetical protein
MRRNNNNNMRVVVRGTMFITRGTKFTIAKVSSLPARPSGKRRLDGSCCTNNDGRLAFIMSGQVFP